MESDEIAPSFHLRPAHLSQFHAFWSRRYRYGQMAHLVNLIDSLVIMIAAPISLLPSNSTDLAAANEFVVALGNENLT
jgi:hypothetical protein